VQNVIQITDHLREIERRINDALARSGRQNESVTIVGVSKRQSLESIETAVAAGLSHLGENYLQEALEKIEAFAKPDIEWHFIGQIQSNKTKPIAANFSWVETLDRARIADRLDAQRPEHLPPLNVLIQLNLDNEPQKAGIGADELLPLARHIAQLPGLKLRGVMGMPPAGQTETERRASFVAIADEARRLHDAGFDVDVVSMGMSSDYELAIECGANLVRIGTALFGAREAANA
jgi:pyridoxal phosphate enzyme (YggS family)